MTTNPNTVSVDELREKMARAAHLEEMAIQGEKADQVIEIDWEMHGWRYLRYVDAILALTTPLVSDESNLADTVLNMMELYFIDVKAGNPNPEAWLECVEACFEGRPAPKRITEQGAEIDRLFEPHQVQNLNAHQLAGYFHGFTCPNRGDGLHGHFNGDLGALVATAAGWICPWCGYTQDWAHDFQKNTWPVHPLTGVEFDGLLTWDKLPDDPPQAPTPASEVE